MPFLPYGRRMQILDAPAKPITLYCAQGMRRFLTGEYGWSSREALMLAYVRDGGTIAGALTPYLNGAAGALPSGYQVLKAPTAISLGGADAAASIHDRTFTYLDSSNVPGEITLWHLWLS
jgi:hypothetical protein